MKDHVSNHALMDMQLIKPQENVHLALKAVKNVRRLETKMEVIQFIKRVQNVKQIGNLLEIHLLIRLFILISM